MKATLAGATFVVAILSCGHTFAAITIDTVLVGDLGNPNDPATGNLYGGVSYAYNIGKYEITVGQFAVFLNAVATTDTYGLYNAGNGIARSGSSGSFAYSAVGSPNHPVTMSSWGSAARFANWLHNGQPTGLQDASTTEDGAYTLNGATSGAALMAVSRNPNATWFIPTESEWYKSAYYQPASRGGDVDNYWLYPMRTNSEPYSDQPPGATPDNTRVGNFYRNDGVANGFDDGYAVSGSPFQSSGSYLTDVGAYTSSPSYYGTFDQGGNVWEWNESLFLGGGHDIRGGAFNDGPVYLMAYSRFYGGATAPPVGFRVANVIPEPVTIALATLGCVCVCTIRGRRSRRA